MSPFESASTAQLLAGDAAWLAPAQVRALAHHPQTSVTTEYPHYVGAVADADGPPRPTDEHPVFYGCFDWHSAVHSHWTLVRLLRLAESQLAGDSETGDDDLESVDCSPTAIRAGFDRRLTEAGVAREVRYLDENPTFERPYGWGWLLRLCAELHLWDDPAAAEWRTTLRPLETRVTDLVRESFLTQERPFRVGTHDNTAFALTCVLDYARVVGDSDLESAASETTRRLYRDDTDYPVRYEPLGWDFLSPALTEADLLRRVCSPDAFAEWLDGFLPDVTTIPHDAVLDPVAVDTAPDEGVALHLAGLNCSRAWCLAGVADALARGPGIDDRPHLVETLRESAARHARHAVDDAFTDDYAGAHWLSSFVCYLLTRAADGIAPEQ